LTAGYPGRVLTTEHVEANVAKVEETVVLAQSDRIVVKDFRSREGNGDRTRASRIWVEK